MSTVPDSVDDRDRRRVLLAVASLLPTLACRPPAASSPPTEPMLLRGAVPDSIAAAGRLYLEAHPEEASVEQLRQVVGLRADETDAAWTERIDAAVRAEIDAGTFVELRGWQLAPTECRLYALASLI